MVVGPSEKGLIKEVWLDNKKCEQNKPESFVGFVGFMIVLLCCYFVEVSMMIYGWDYLSLQMKQNAVQFSLS